MIIVMGLSMFLRQSLRSALPLSSSSNLASQPYQSPAALAFDLPRMAAAESYGARQAGKAKYSVPYLKLYNTLQMIGWLSASLLTLVGLFSTGDDVWTLAAPTVRVCQGAAVLEVLHAAIGIVRGSPLTALLQWFGRANVLFGILSYVPEVQKGLGVSLIFLAWTLSECVRYPWYLSTLLDTPSNRLTWLRYSCFIPLYPLGVTGEVLVTVKALRFIRQRQLHSVTLPNAVNFAFDYYWFCLVGISTAMPVAFVLLYIHMLKQRKAKLLRPSQALDKKKKKT